MKTKPTFENFVEEIERMAIELFNQHGKLNPSIGFMSVRVGNVIKKMKHLKSDMELSSIPIEDHDKISITMFPILFKNNEEKKHAHKMISVLVAEMEPEYFAFVTECYVSKQNTKDMSEEEVEKLHYIKPSEDPNRTEAIILNFESVDKDYGFSILEIIRDKDGHPTLIKDEKASGINKHRPKGLFTHIFESAQKMKELKAYSFTDDTPSKEEKELLKESDNHVKDAGDKIRNLLSRL